LKLYTVHEYENILNSCLTQTHTDINNQHMNLNNGDNKKIRVTMHAGFQDSIKLPACNAV